MTIPIVIHAALSLNSVIGAANAMPWSLSSDLKRFKRLTLGHPYIMGRKTFESIGRALPGRKNIIVTRDTSFSAPNIYCVGSLGEAIECARNHIIDENVENGQICIGGGGQIYAQAIAKANIMHLTRVLENIEGDTYFPDFDETKWELRETLNVGAGLKDSHPTRYEVWYRRAEG